MRYLLICHLMIVHILCIINMYAHLVDTRLETYSLFFTRLDPLVVLYVPPLLLAAATFFQGNKRACLLEGDYKRIYIARHTRTRTQYIVGTNMANPGKSHCLVALAHYVMRLRRSIRRQPWSTIYTT